ALRDGGQLDDTVIFFASDNGGERFSRNQPLSGRKGEVLEGGIRVPTIVSWPSRIRGRQVVHEPVVTMDWTATFLERAGASPDPRYRLDGVSLVDHLLHGNPVRRDLFWRMKDQRALRRGNLKYVRLRDGADHLYDLTADASELADLAARRRDDLRPLRAAWEAINAGLLPSPAWGAELSLGLGADGELRPVVGAAWDCACGLAVPPFTAASAARVELAHARLAVTDAISRADGEALAIHARDPVIDSVTAERQSAHEK